MIIAKDDMLLRLKATGNTCRFTTCVFRRKKLDSKIVYEEERLAQAEDHTKGKKAVPPEIEAAIKNVAKESR